jgi:ribonuclease BN (tRNA processing enzyme)
VGQTVTLGITVLGSSGMFATTERACSGYLLETGRSRLWMDAGAGTWRNLLGHVAYTSLDGVLLSHCHPDHTTDVFQALHAREFGGAEPLPPIPLWAPRQTLDRLIAFGSGIEDSFDLRAITAGESHEIAGARFSFVEMAHPVETLGIRVDVGGAVLAYSADTGPSADLSALASGAELFVCEATLQDSDELWSGHMSASQSGRAAGDLGVGTLLLTHLPPGRDVLLSLAQAQAAADGTRVQLAMDGEHLEVGSG